MKNYLLLLLLYCLGSKNSLAATADSTSLKLFNKAIAFYQKGMPDSAIASWKEIIDNNMTENKDVYGQALFNIPTAYWEQEHYEAARLWYKKVIASDVKDGDETGNLMEPHANYKHKAAMALAGLSELDSNYTEALNWLFKADTLYRYWGFEGSATNISKKQAYLLSWKTHIFLALQQKEAAIQAIIIELICAGVLESFFSESEEKLMALVEKQHFRSAIDTAIAGLEIKQEENNRWLLSFKLNGTDYHIPVSSKYPDQAPPHYWRILFMSEADAGDKQRIIDYIKDRSFYKRLAD